MSTFNPMVAARVFAVVVIAGVGAAAFVLSFTTLRDLAQLAHIPAGTAWLFPLIVDGTIIQATLGWLVLANSSDRKYFVWVLAAGSLVSVAGNSIHAVANGHQLPGWLCAVVAAIAPISLLIDTHGLAVLFRASQSSPAGALEPSAEVTTGPPAAAAVPVAPEPATTISEPVPVPAAPVAPPTPAPASVPVPSRPVVPPVRPVRPARPVPPMRPIAVPTGS